MPLGQAEAIAEGVKIAGLVDQVNWHAINAVTVNPEGQLEFDEIYEIETHIHHTAIPVTLPLNLNIQGVVLCKNTASVTLMMQAVVWFIDPDGLVRAYYEGSWSNHGAGSSYTVFTNGIVLDKPGNWTLYAELYAEVA